MSQVTSGFGVPVALQVSLAALPSTTSTVVATGVISGLVPSTESLPTN